MAGSDVGSKVAIGVVALILWSGLVYFVGLNQGKADGAANVARLEREMAARDAMVVGAMSEARQNSQKNTCISNLKQIESAKEQWAMVNKMGATDAPTEQMLVGDATSGFLNAYPTCPTGGTYTIGNMSTRPTCTRAAEDHSLE
ncbi:MAG TPA: hypothetical protein VK934_02880 [Fimbriimonas sp.]|nr:hypothetical protein [Fimbriimonas sp.]